MATPAAPADAHPVSTQLPPAPTHTGDGAAGESAGGSGGSDEGDHDNGNDAPVKENGDGDDPEGGTGTKGDEQSPRKMGDIPEDEPDAMDVDSPRDMADSDEEKGSVPTETAPADSPSGDTSETVPPLGVQGGSLQEEAPAKIATLLTLEEVAAHVRRGHLPQCRVLPTGHQNTRPTTRTIPPRHIEDGASFIVGVPADARTLRNGAFVQDGYAGTESLMMFNGLSPQDIEALVDLVGDRSEVHELILRPYLTHERPDIAAMEMMVGSLAVRREMASLGAHLPLYGLAQRVLYTLSPLHRVLERDRQRALLVQGGSSTAEMLKLQTKYDQLKREYKLLNDYYQKEVESARDRTAEVKGVLSYDFEQLAAENLHELNSLRGQVSSLSSQLEMANKRVRELERRLKEGTFNGSDLMAYLNEGDSEVRGNWPRLARILRCYQNEIKPPSSWKTWVTVDAADKRSRWVPPYPDSPPADSDDDEDLGDNIADEESKSEERPPSSGKPVVDMTGGSSSSDSPPSTPKGKGRNSRRGSVSTVARTPDKSEYQRLPSTLVPCTKSPRPADEKFPHSVKDCRGRLPEFVAWEHLRRDVQLVMLAGSGYAEAVDRMGKDKPAHHLFFRRDLLEMLATMMHRQCLDSTPWTKYVQERYHTMAVSVIKTRDAQQETHPEWPRLTNISEELGFIEGGEDDVDEDHASDDSYDDKAERQAKKQARQERAGLLKATPKRKSPSKSPKKKAAAASPSQSDESDDEVVQPPRRKQKIMAVYSSSDSGDDRAPTGGFYTPSSSKKRPSRLSASGSAKNTRANLSRSELERLKPPLARKDYKTLTTAELAAIEIPDQGILSWRRRGILTCYSPKKKNVVKQTPGETRHLARRWLAVEAAYSKLLASKPWVKMFNARVKKLYFHERSMLTATQKALLDEYILFVRDNAQAFYDVLHWITMKTKAWKDEICPDPTIYNSAAGLSATRAARREHVDRTFPAFLESFFARGLPRTMIYEPGFWVYPAKICHLYLTDPSTVNEEGKPFSLKEQIQLAEKEEPIRTQFTRYCTDYDRIASVPADIRSRLVEDRARNWVSKTVQDL